jgi:membrane protease YdiL (CAAX protease family)
MILRAILPGLLVFMLPVGLSMGLVTLNARFAPEHAWFPLPIFGLCIAVAWLAERRWRIGLAHPPGVAWTRVYLLAFTTSVVGVCIAILQGAAFGMTRGAELWPGEVGPQFQFAFAFVMPLVVAILAEVGFRGVMQGRLHRVMGPWTAIILVTVINTAAHRWGADLQAQWLGYAVLLAGCGYVRWLSGSVLPALAAHVGQNLALAWVTWSYGPFDLGALSASALVWTAAIAMVALGVTIAVGRGLRPLAMS